MKLGIVLLIVQISTLSAHEVKLIDGVEKKGDRSGGGLPYSEPSDFTGPMSLTFLNGLCFNSTIDRYEFVVCPFQNVTQRRLIGSQLTLLGK
jgi:hypothetical protein